MNKNTGITGTHGAVRAVQPGLDCNGIEIVTHTRYVEQSVSALENALESLESRLSAIIASTDEADSVSPHRSAKTNLGSELTNIEYRVDDATKRINSIIDRL